MKPIKFTKEAKAKLKALFDKQLEKELEDFSGNATQTKFNFSFDCSVQEKEKVKIVFTPIAYLKMKALVEYYDTEVAWYGLVEREGKKRFRVYDIRICEQYVNGGKVDTEDEDVIKFFDSLSDEEINHMHFQAHSHVRFSTDASGTDIENQQDMIANLGNEGFFIFQIWNKNNDINTYLYDLDNNKFYDRKDVEIDVDFGEQTMSGFAKSTDNLVKTRYYIPNPYRKSGTKDKCKTYYPAYYGGGYDW